MLLNHKLGEQVNKIFNKQNMIIKERYATDNYSGAGN